MPETKTLLLFPTRFELDKVSRRVDALAKAHDLSVAVCGFGILESGLETIAYLSKHADKSFKKVILCGVAGSLSSRLTVGNAYQFRFVGCYGVGVGSGASFQSDHELGWMVNELWIPLPVDEQGSAQDEIQDHLLSVCAASADLSEVECKQGKYPKAVAEEMEGYSVATACAKLKLPLHIVRGISNTAGNRDHSQWKVDDALTAAMQIVERIVSK